MSAVGNPQKKVRFESKEDEFDRMWDEEMQGGTAQSNNKKSARAAKEKKIQFSRKVDED